MRTGIALKEILEFGPGGFEPPKAFYLHIPLCRSRCSYCDFHSFDISAMPKSAMDSYIHALIARISSLGREPFSELETIYMGGGTPSVLGEAALDRLLAAAGEVSGGRVREWTVECNPESLSPSKIDIMKKRGVTRLSLGIQSMDNEELELLGRRGNEKLNEKALGMALDSGLAVSADLIAGLPSRFPAARSRLLHSAEYLAVSGIGHISLYDLTVEEGTPLAARLESGSIKAMDEESAIEERKAAEGILESSGFVRYEVSNFALPGQESRHNSIYWEMLSYLGLGSGAVSTLAANTGAPDYAGRAALRISEVRDLEIFGSDADAGMEFEIIPPRVAAFETIMMGLRTARGIDAGRFKRRFGRLPHDLFPVTLEKWGSRFTLSGASVRLDGPGMDILNSILVDIGTEIDKMTDFFSGGDHE